MNSVDMRELSDAELDGVSAGDPNLGGYTYCSGPGIREGLYVGPCPTPPPSGGLGGAMMQGGVTGGAGGIR